MQIKHMDKRETGVLFILSVKNGLNFGGNSGVNSHLL